jgi:hypothetical protein
VWWVVTVGSDPFWQKDEYLQASARLCDLAGVTQPREASKKSSEDFQIP